ncbi:MAG: sensor domain-containing diguanylate cyclase [Gammaproteobacteria bacterium]|nr:sensor domain-containing diguanylate cyclase [Gammaproteobacteria bacterium]
MLDINETSVDSQKMLKKIADTLYLHALTSNGTILFITLIFFFILSSYSNSSFHFIWSLVMTAAAVYRLFLCYQRKNTPVLRPDAQWINHYILGSMIVGCSWGSLFLLPYVNPDLTLFGVFLMVFFGVTASAIPVLSVSLVAFVVYTLPIVVCFIISLHTLNYAVDYYLSASVFVYFIMLVLLARNNNKQTIHSLALRLKNEALINQLRKEIIHREELIHSRTKELERSRQKILDSENRLQNVIVGAGLGYWDWNYQTGHQIVNSRWLDILGLSRGDIENNVTDWDIRIHPDDKQRMIDTIENAIKTNTPYVADFRMKHKDGYWVWIQGSGALIESDSVTHEPIRLCGTHQDISCRKNMEKELEFRAKHDHLTGLFNRVELEKYFQKELSRSERYGRSLSIFLIDIDHFKQINDTYGHPVGDRVLKKYANFLQETIRNTDFLSRYGGEEFVIILPETSLKEAEELAERLRIKTHNFNLDLGNRQFNITISLGIATYPDHGQECDTILERADQAMYQAKRKGRNRVHTWR